MTYGEKAVGLTFNPSGDPLVIQVKKAFAEIIDLCNDERAAAGQSEKGRLLSVAITEAQTAQMWAVKGITFEAESTQSSTHPKPAVPPMRLERKP